MRAGSKPIGVGRIGVGQEATAIVGCFKAVQAVVRAALVWRSATWRGGPRQWRAALPTRNAPRRTRRLARTVVLALLTDLGRWDLLPRLL
ncbi:Uncharacterised protein [Achromobacter spanius]|nr:hypothetical protein LMG5911_02179 [Achromobacter spanius]SPT41494.1 Uncharacterised protein [Achromobacter denitrificans]VEE59557.1 Uncharacterised protein [Achromobacter spanius]